MLYYCKSCKNEIKENDIICSRCGLPVNDSNDPNAKINMKKESKVVRIMKSYLIFLGIAIGWFFIFTMTIFFMKANDKEVSNIMTILQIGIPILILVFGFLASLLIVNKKEKLALKETIEE